METPYKIAEDTYVIPGFAFSPGFGFLPVNAFLIKAQEPVLIDSGMSVDRDDFMQALRSLIDPSELRWIVLTHEEKDHTGAVQQVLEEAPDARFVVTWIMVGKMMAEWVVPMPRARLLNHGERLSAGDREIVAVPPIVFDSPATNSYYDTKTGVYFAADAFGAFLPSQASALADVPEDKAMEGFNIFNRANHPWTAFVDGDKFAARLKAVVDLKPSAIGSAHLPPIVADRTDAMFKAIAAIPSMDPFILPDQAFLEKMLGQITAGGGPPGA
jgi:hypothetical protein